MAVSVTYNNEEFLARVRLLEVDGVDGLHRPPLTPEQRAALRRYLDALDAVDVAVESPTTLAHLREVAVESELPESWARLRAVVANSYCATSRQTGDAVVYATIDREIGFGPRFAGGLLVCRTHLLELQVFRFGGRKLKVRALGVRERLAHEEMRELCHDESPLCQMCRAHVAHGNVCYRDACAAPLHPQWPVVYCSNDCAMEDL